MYIRGLVYNVILFQVKPALQTSCAWLDQNKGAILSYSLLLQNMLYDSSIFENFTGIQSVSQSDFPEHNNVSSHDNMDLYDTTMYLICYLVSKSINHL